MLFLNFCKHKIIKEFFKEAREYFGDYNLAKMILGKKLSLCESRADNLKVGSVKYDRNVQLNKKRSFLFSGENRESEFSKPDLQFGKNPGDLSGINLNYYNKNVGKLEMDSVAYNKDKELYDVGFGKDFEQISDEYSLIEDFINQNISYDNVLKTLKNWLDIYSKKNTVNPDEILGFFGNAILNKLHIEKPMNWKILLGSKVIERFSDKLSVDIRQEKNAKHSMLINNIINKANDNIIKYEKKFTKPNVVDQFKTQFLNNQQNRDYVRQQEKAKGNNPKTGTNIDLILRHDFTNYDEIIDNYHKVEEELKRENKWGKLPFCVSLIHAKQMYEDLRIKLYKLLRRLNDSLAIDYNALKYKIDAFIDERLEHEIKGSYHKFGCEKKFEDLKNYNDNKSKEKEESSITRKKTLIDQIEKLKEVLINWEEQGFVDIEQVFAFDVDYDKLMNHPKFKLVEWEKWLNLLLSDKNESIKIESFNKKYENIKNILDEVK